MLAQTENHNVIIIHLNEALKQLALFRKKSIQQDFCNGFNLKDRWDFKNLCKSNSTLPADSRILDIKMFKQALKSFIREFRIKPKFSLDSSIFAPETIHSESDLFRDRYLLVRMLFQSTTGVRFQDTLGLSQTNWVKKSCQCRRYRLCNIPTKECFHVFKFYSPKTKTINETFLTPFSFELFLQLSSFVSNSKNQSETIVKKYNKYLHNNYNISSHKLRKFLPNLVTLSGSEEFMNTGNWKSAKCMTKHYVHNVTKFIILHKIIMKEIIYN